MINSFRKPRLDQVVIVDNSGNSIARFSQIYQTFKKRNFASAVGSSIGGPYPMTEWNNLPFYYGKQTVTSNTYSIYHVPGQHDPHPLGVAYAGPYTCPAEVQSRAQFPLAEAVAGTYLFDYDIGGTAGQVDLSADIGGITKGKLDDIVARLNSDAAFNTVAEAYVIGSGLATALGIQSITEGAAVTLEIVTGGANDCSELLGFKAEFDNLYDEGGTDSLVGTFDDNTNVKAS